WSLFWPYIRRGARKGSLHIRRGLRHLRVPLHTGRHPLHPESGREPPWGGLLRADFVRRVGLKDRYKASRSARPVRARSEREGHFRRLTGHAQGEALEILNKAAAAHSLELRFPFWDKRLV